MKVEGPIDEYSDLHRALLKSELQPFAVFKKYFLKIREMSQPIGRKRCGKIK
jgi:hypothetical protein